jgi:hypothetical protein
MACQTQIVIEQFVTRMRGVGRRRRTRPRSKGRHVHHMEFGSHAVVTCAAELMAEQLINMRLIELDPSIIHHAGHSHQIEICAQQN